MADVLLARHAFGMFWLARYLERAENLARILDINATYARDRRGDQDWLPVLQLNSDQERFVERHPNPSPSAVLRFYVTDRENPTSIISAVASARENALTLRPLISAEMWAQLNIFNKWMRELDDDAIRPGQLPRLLSQIRTACQTHAGITEGTLHRDQGSYFYRLGRHVERADQTTRLLDIKYHTLLPAATDVGEAVDIAQWKVLLRSAAAHYAYLRADPDGLTPHGVAGFLLLHPRFPRSLSFSITEADRLFGVYRSRYAIGHGEAAAQALRELQSELETLTIATIMARGLHEFLDDVQRRLIAVTDNLGEAFFNRPSAAKQSQG